MSGNMRERGTLAGEWDSVKPSSAAVKLSGRRALDLEMVGVTAEELRGRYIKPFFFSPYWMNMNE